MAKDDQTDPGRLDDLATRAADDVAALAHQYASVAKREVAVAGERAAWPAATGVGGALMALVGTGMLLALPAVPSSDRRLRRRMRLFAVGYLFVGGLGCAFGFVGVGDALTRALPRTRRGLHSLIGALRRAAP